MKPLRPLVLAILDGWGLGKPSPVNAIYQASTPNMDFWQSHFPHTRLVAYGEKVGLSGSTTGNSEVGHINIGAGYPVPQSEVQINTAIQNGSFDQNPALLDAMQNVIGDDSSLHVVSLVGPGLVHSSIEHLWALLRLTKSQKVDKVYVHLVSDGRDASPSWLGKNAETIQAKIESFDAQVASVCGRYYAMDRDGRWDRVELAYRLLTEKKGQRFASLDTAMSHYYGHDISDEFVPPTVIANGRTLTPQDSVIFLNYRPDRARQLSQALCLNDFPHFARQHEQYSLYTLTSYQDALPVKGVVFPPHRVEMPLARVISEAGLRQLHAAESEKYAHVTYFLNGGREEAFAMEDRLLVDSPKVATYDLQPAMSAMELTDKVIQTINNREHDVVIINYANADMVAHTGNLPATISAIEVVDTCLGDLYAAIEAQGGILAITADHGNAEVLVAADGEMDTQHNSGYVPFMIISQELKGKLEEGSLANVAPTLLSLLNLKKPETMTAESLWQQK